MEGESNGSKAGLVWLFVLGTAALTYAAKKLSKSNKKPSLLQYTIKKEENKVDRTAVAPSKDTLHESVSMKGRELEK